jgi:hypothetical protein
MVPAHRPAGFAGGAAHPPVYRWDRSKYLKPNNAGRRWDIAATGHSPFALATLKLTSGNPEVPPSSVGKNKSGRGISPRPL